MGIFVACAIALAPGRAHARAVTVVLVAHRPFAGPREAERVRLAIVRAARVSGWEVRAGDPVEAAALEAGRGVDASTLAFAGNVRRLHDEADAELRALDFAGARTALDDAEALLRRHLALPLVVRWLAETGVRRAIVEWSAGDAAAAREAIDRVLSLDPDRRLTTDEAHPELAALVETVRREREARPHVTVTVDASIPGATVWCDDEEAGTSPASLSIGTGRHVIRAQAPGSGVAVTEVEVGPQGMPPIQLVLPDSTAARRIRALPADLLRPGRPVAATVAEVASLADANVALVGLVTMHRGDLGVVLQAVGPGGAGSRLAVSLSGVDEAVGAILATDPGSRAVTLASHEWIAAPDPDPAGPIETPAFYERWWFWAATGMGLIGGAALTYGIAKPDAQPRFIGNDEGVD